MIKILSRTVALLALTSCLHAQDFDNYQHLQPTGPIPAEFLTPSSVKYEKEIALMGEGMKAKEQKARKQFYLESHFTIDDLLQSGKVLFNDPVTAYVNKVADEVLRDDPALRAKIRIYLVASPVVNAFATSSGIIFINMGLIAQLENEAQLAFILSHEFTHVDKNHTLELFLDSKGLGKDASRREMLKKADFDESIIAKHSYSKELEHEADMEGLKRYLAGNYSVDAVNSVFDVLLYSYLPFDDEPFDRTFFNSEHLKLPSKLFLDSVKTILGADEDEDDSRSTHPNIAKRRREVMAGLNGYTEGNRKKFIVSEKDFYKFREVCRYEIAWLNCHKGAYKEAIYDAYLLLKAHPQSVYLQKIILKSLYGLVKYRNDEGNRPSGFGHQNIEGESQQVYYLMDHLSNEELNVLALHYGWNLQLKFPADQETASLTDEIFQEMVIHHHQDPSYFTNTKEADTLAKEKKAVVADAESEVLKSKYDKIREKKAEKGDEQKAANFTKYAFTSYISDTTFTNRFAIHLKEKERRENLKAYYESDKGKKELKMEKRYGTSLGIDKILVAPPLYFSLDARDNVPEIQFIKSEQGQTNLRRATMKSAKTVGIEVTILDPNKLDSSNIAQFNDITLLRNWLYEQSEANFMLQGTQQEAVEKLADKYGTDYVLLHGVIVSRIKNPYFIQQFFLGVVIWPILPFVIPFMVKPYHEMLYFSILYDVKNRRYQNVDLSYYKKKDSNATLEKLTYRTLNRIKRKSRK